MALPRLKKDASPDELVHTIHSAYLGNLTLSADMFQLVISASNGASLMILAAVKPLSNAA